MDRNIPNQGQGYLGSSCKCSTPHFKSNEVQLKCKGHLRFLFIYIELHEASKLNFRTMDQLL